MKKYTNKILIIAGVVFIVVFVILTKITVNGMREDMVETIEIEYNGEDMSENDVDFPGMIYTEEITVDEDVSGNDSDSTFGAE